MKKFFILIIAIAAMLNFSSCSDEQIDKPSPRTAIVFNDVQTRGIVRNANDILSMGVFAQMNLGDEDKEEAGSNSYNMLLENEHVSRESDLADWTYEHTSYWVTDRIFHFFAVWPYSGDNSSVTNVSSVAGDGAYGYSVTFETPETADQELLTAKATIKTKTGVEFPESVGFNFQHELTNVNLNIWSNGAPENVQDEIRVKEVTISNVTKTGTLNVAALSDSSWSYSSTKMAFTKNYGDDGITVSQAQIIDGKLVPNEVSQYNPSKDNQGIPFGDGLLLIPHTITQSTPVVVTVKYDLKRPIDEVWESKKLQVLLPDGTWPAGRRLTYNLVLSGDRTITDFQINAIVEDWKMQTEEVHFSDQVEVDEGETLYWIPGTYESLNVKRGEVVLYTDIDKVAICEFNIRAPI